MKTYAISGALSGVLAGALIAGSALPAAAQTWYDPATLIHNSYVELEGGASVQGRTKIKIEATGLGSSAQSASQNDKAFGGGLVGYKLADGVAIEGEGIYTRNNLTYSPTNAVFGVGGLVYGCSLLVLETRLALLNVTEEADFVRARFADYVKHSPQGDAPG